MKTNEEGVGERILGIAGSKGSEYQEKCDMIFSEKSFWNWCDVTVMKHILVSTVEPFIDDPTAPGHRCCRI